MLCRTSLFRGFARLDQRAAVRSLPHHACSTTRLGRRCTIAKFDTSVLPGILVDPPWSQNILHCCTSFLILVFLTFIIRHPSCTHTQSDYPPAYIFIGAFFHLPLLRLSFLLRPGLCFILSSLDLHYLLASRTRLRRPHIPRTPLLIVQFSVLVSLTYRSSQIA